MASRKAVQTFEDVPMIEDDEVVVSFGVGASPTASVLPARVARLRGDSLIVVEELQSLRAESMRIAHDIDLMVREARGMGVSWSIIAWAVGMTENGAKRRFGDS